MSVLNTLKNLDEYFKEIRKKADAVKDGFRELLNSSSIAIMFSFNWLRSLACTMKLSKIGKGSKHLQPELYLLHI